MEDKNIRNLNRISAMRGNKGIALLLALFSLLFISLLVVAFLDIVTIDRQIATNQIRDLQASFIADAGAETAIYELRQDDEYSGTGGDVQFPNPKDPNNPYDTYYNVSVSGNTITSTGKLFTDTALRFSRTIEVNFSLTGGSLPYTVKINTWREVE